MLLGLFAVATEHNLSVMLPVLERFVVAQPFKCGSHFEMAQAKGPSFIAHGAFELRKSRVQSVDTRAAHARGNWFLGIPFALRAQLNLYVFFLTNIAKASGYLLLCIGLMLVHCV